MAFTNTITGNSVWGNKRVAWGTWTTDTTGGDLDTGLTMVDFIFLQTITTAPTEAPAVAETLPVAGSAVTIAVTSSSDGYWLAFGY